jgi:hypothetical protein
MHNILYAITPSLIRIPIIVALYIPYLVGFRGELVE